MLWELRLNRLQWRMVAKHAKNPKHFYFASTLDATQIAALPADVDGKPRLESGQTLISNLYLCLGEKGQNELNKWEILLELAATRCPRVLDAMEGEFRKERNETYEVFQQLSRKQRIGESLEQFHSFPSGLAARCFFGTL